MYRYHASERHKNIAALSRTLYTKGRNCSYIVIAKDIQKIPWRPEVSSKFGTLHCFLLLFLDSFDLKVDKQDSSRHLTLSSSEDGRWPPSGFVTTCWILTASSASTPPRTSLWGLYCKPTTRTFLFYLIPVLLFSTRVSWSLSISPPLVRLPWANIRVFKKLQKVPWLISVGARQSGEHLSSLCSLDRRSTADNNLVLFHFAICTEILRIFLKLIKDWSDRESGILKEFLSLSVSFSAIDCRFD